MKIDKIEYPFSELYKNGYIVMGQNGRRNICLMDKQNNRVTTIAYARYLMSVKLGRFLKADEEVDHIDNDPTNDTIENLQILSGEANRNKYFILREQQHDHGTMFWYRKGCRCTACIEAAKIYGKEQRARAKQRLAAGMLPKSPEERYPIKAAEKRLGRSLDKGECFWHLDGDTSNNTIDNLIIFKSFVDRRRFKASGANADLLKYNQDGTCTVDLVYKPRKQSSKYKYTCVQCGKMFETGVKRRIEAAFCSRACCQLYRSLHNKSRCPEVDELLKAFESIRTFRGVGKRYGVTDNTTKKWCIKLGILEQIQKIIDESKKETFKKNSRPKTEKEKAAMIANLKVYWAEHTHSMAIGVDKLDPITGSIITTYSSMREAARDGFIDHCIAKCCRGAAKTHKGYKWRFHS